MDNAGIHDRRAVLRVVRAVLAADLACAESAVVDGGISVTTAEERPGRRRFPLRRKPLDIATMGAGVVVSCHPERVDWLCANLGHLQRDAVFSATTVAQLARYVEPDGQALGGPVLRYVCSQTDLRPAISPDDVAIAVVEAEDVRRLYDYPGFTNALAYRRDTPRPDVLATVATRMGEVLGIAGASADCDALWQIGVDVVAHARGRGIGKALVGRLTEAVFHQGRVPYYSTLVSNLHSRALASGLGYWPAWVDLGVRDLQSEAAANPPDVARTTAIPTLTDGVVALDGHTLADLEAHLAGEDEEQARRFGWFPAHSTPETVRAAIVRWQEEWRTGGSRRAFAARAIASGQLVGGCEIRLQGSGIAHMSYWVFPPFRRRGYASRAVRLGCTYAFAELGVERMELYVDTDNVGSRGVARKAGFVEEGTLRKHAQLGGERRDMVLYSRLSTDSAS